jgi:hypothetical protein
MAPKKQHEWEIYVLRKKGDFLGTVEAPDRDTIQELKITDPEKQKRLSAQRRA